MTCKDCGKLRCTARKELDKSEKKCAVSKELWNRYKKAEQQELDFGEEVVPASPKKRGKKDDAE